MTNRHAFYSVAAFITLIIAGCATYAEPEGLTSPWSRAEIHVFTERTGYIFGRPGDKYVLRRLAEIPPGEQLPTVVYLHGSKIGGCRVAKGHAELLNGAGYAVIMPNTCAHKDYYDPCDPVTYRCHGEGLIVRMRLADLRHALEQIRKLAWVDQENLFLMGFSEGGYTAAAYPGNEFRGVIVIGTTCHFGVRAPLSTPVMSIRSAGDPWVMPYTSRCERKGVARETPLESVIIPGVAAHNVVVYREAREAILDFLKRYTTRHP